MEKVDRQSGGLEQTGGSHESQQRPAPGKVTRTSKLSPGGGPAVQRKAPAPTPGAAAQQGRSSWDLTMDPAMDAAHRGVTALANGGRNPVQARRKRPGAQRPANAMATDTTVERTGSLSNAYGTFKFAIKKNAGANGCSFEVEFQSFNPEVDATKLTFIQTIKGHKAGGAVFYLNSDNAYYADFDAAGDGTYTDHLKGETDPFYNYEDKTSSDESVGTTGASKTTMEDAPRIGSIAGERGQEFETAPFALSGNDKGEFFGTLTWGWKIDSGGTFSLSPVAVHDDITTSFGAALRKFVEKIGDKTKTSGTPAPATITMPLDVCRELTTTEKAMLQPLATFAKTNASARIWAIARYTDKGAGAEANHAMAMDNVKSVQTYLTREGVAADKIRITAVQEAAAPDPKVSPIEITIINT